jgi:hypothetical protein
MAKRVKESVPTEEIVQVEEPVEQEVAVVPVEEPEPIPAPEPVVSGPSFGQRVRGFFSFLFRLILTLILLAAIGVGLYFVLPLVYQKYILPVQQNTDQLQQLRDQQTQSEQTIADLQTQLSALESEQTEQADSLTNLNQRVNEIETQITARTESLETLEKMQATLQSQNDETNAEVGRQINLLKAMELLSRSHLFMYQSNFGLAKQDVQSARDLLATVQLDAPEPLADDLKAVILRLDLTLSNLPDFPVAASDDLDIAWQILLGGLPQTQTLVSGEPLSPETTLTPNPEMTVTPQVTLTPTATP